MRKLTAAIACRNQGSRLYGKPLQNLDIENRKCILDNIVACLSNFDCISSIILGIAEGTENLSYIDYAQNNNLDYITGDETDVLSRLIQCGKHVGATDIFRITSESPFPYFENINYCWDLHQESNNDATFLDNIIDGCGFELIRLEALINSHKRGSKKHRSELCTLYIRENKTDFRIEFIKPPPELMRRDLRLTVDCPEDLIVCRSVFEEFKNQAPLIPVSEVVRFLDKNDNLKKIIEPFCEVGYKTMYL